MKEQAQQVNWRCNWKMTDRISRSIVWCFASLIESRDESRFGKKTTVLYRSRTTQFQRFNQSLEAFQAVQAPLSPSLNPDFVHNHVPRNPARKIKKCLIYTLWDVSQPLCRPIIDCLAARLSVDRFHFFLIRYQRKHQWENQPQGVYPKLLQTYPLKTEVVQQPLHLAVDVRPMKVVDKRHLERVA